MIYKSPHIVLYEVEQEHEPEPTGNLFRILHDGETELFTPRRGMPEVYTLYDRAFPFTREMQELAYALFLYGALSLPNNLKGTRYSSVYQERKAFCNKKGYGSTNVINYILGDNVGNEDSVLPEFDKVRICGGATVKGTIERGYRWWNYVNKNYQFEDVVWIETIDPANLPSLDALINSGLYFHATTSYVQRAGQFPNGQQPELGIYEPTLVPLFSPWPVCWPLRYCQSVNAIANPYRFGG